MYLKRPAGGLAFCLFYLASCFTNKVREGGELPPSSPASEGPGQIEEEGMRVAGQSLRCSGSRGLRLRSVLGHGRRRRRRRDCVLFLPCPAQGKPAEESYPSGTSDQRRTPVCAPT